MVIIFIHLYFVIVFEILFYIYYIMPYEKTLIYDLFDITDYTSSIQNYSLIEEHIENQLKCDASQERIDKYNHTLWLKCMWFIGILSVILAAVFVRDGWRTWKLYLALTDGENKITKHNSRTQLVESEVLGNASPKHVTKPFEYKKNDDQVNQDIVIITDTFGIYYWKNSKFVKNMGKTVRFIILVGIFEYAFFTLIVNKYKIVNTKTLLCKMVGAS